MPLFGADPPAWQANLWLLPLVLGACSIFWLLPKPRGGPVLTGALIGIIALVVAGLLLVQPGPWTTNTAPATILFYAFSGIAILAGALLVTQSNPARAALSFALVVLATCGLFLLLAAPFLMAATIIVYAGAIIVTFLFVLMLAQQEGASNADLRSREPLLATLTGFVLLGALLYVLRLGYTTREFDELHERVQAAIDEVNPETLHQEEWRKETESLFDRSGQLLRLHGWKDLRGRSDDLLFDWLTAESKLKEKRQPLVRLEEVIVEARDRLGTVNPPANIPLSGLSGPPANTPAAEIRRDRTTRLPQLPAENSAYLGRSLFTDFLLPVELAGTLLLVATIGAIALGQRRGEPEPGDRASFPSGPGTPPGKQITLPRDTVTR